MWYMQNNLITYVLMFYKQGKRRSCSFYFGNKINNKLKDFKCPIKKTTLIRIWYRVKLPKTYNGWSKVSIIYFRSLKCI